MPKPKRKRDEIEVTEEMEVEGMFAFNPSYEHEPLALQLGRAYRAMAKIAAKTSK